MIRGVRTPRLPAAGGASSTPALSTNFGILVQDPRTAVSRQTHDSFETRICAGHDRLAATKCQGVASFFSLHTLTFGPLHHEMVRAAARHGACHAATRACRTATRACRAATRGLSHCDTGLSRRDTGLVTLRHGFVALRHGWCHAATRACRAATRACRAATRVVSRCDTGLSRCDTRLSPSPILRSICAICG